jgi:glutamine amidotransferase
MCELFAMSSLEPATVSFSLNELARHGGETGPHKDGWGVAFYAGTDVRIVREASAASDSPSMEFVKEQHFRSNIVVSHIRKATMGAIELANTQPFARELGGRMHVFAHNGELEGTDGLGDLREGRYRPVGDTDSERAFCSLLNQLQELWLAEASPTIEDRLGVVCRFAARVRDHGSANFIYSDSELLFVHGHKRSEHEGEDLRPPGLYTLCRTCPSRRSAGTHGPGDVVTRTKHLDGLEIGLSEKKQQVVLVASVPLTEEGWTPLDEGEVLVVAGGRVLRSERGATVAA